MCRIETEGEFNVSSGQIVLPKTAQAVLGEHIDMDKLWTCLYNSQQKAQLLPDKNGCYLINGEPIKAENLIIAPFNENIVRESTKFYLAPPAFPKPFEIEIGSLKNKQKVMIQRNPNNSISKMKFQSISKGALNINFTIDSETNEIVFNVEVTEKNALNIEDVVNSNEIYNAFVLGEGHICGGKIFVKKSHIDALIPEEVMDFWNKVLELERYLNIKFNPNEEITIDLVNTISILYRCLIEKMPYKKFENFESVSGKGFNKKTEVINDIVGKVIYFEMQADCSVELMGNKIELNQLIGIFNAVVVTHDLPKQGENGEFKIALTAKENTKMYTGNMLFLKEKDLVEFKDKSDHIKILENAEEVGNGLEECSEGGAI